MTPEEADERALIAAAPLLRRARRQPGFASDFARLTLLRSPRGQLVLKRLFPSVTLARLDQDAAERALGALPRRPNVLCRPVRIAGQLRPTSPNGVSYLALRRLRLDRDRNLFAEWRESLDRFVRFHEGLVADLAPLAPQAQAFAALGPQDDPWRTPPGWSWGRTAAALGEERSARCAPLLTLAERAPLGDLDAVAHRDVVGRNVGVTLSGRPVLFDIDDMGHATRWLDALTSGTWAGLDDDALERVIGALTGPLGRAPRRLDVALALLLVVRRFADELRRGADPAAPGYLSGHGARIDRLLRLAARC